MENKKGQFYLITVVILLAIIIGFATTSNYLKKKNTSDIYSLKAELEIEAEKVLDYESMQGENKIESFIGNYSEYAKNPGRKFYFIFGESESLEAYQYDENGKEPFNFEVNDDKIIVNVDGTDYEFNLKSGKNFYFIITQENNGGKYIVTN